MKVKEQKQQMEIKGKNFSHKFPYFVVYAIGMKDIHILTICVKYMKENILLYKY